MVDQLEMPADSTQTFRADFAAENFSSTAVVEINDIERLEDFRLSWSKLLSGTRGASFFYTLDWLKCYWRHFGDGQRLRVLVVTHRNEPIGIIPLTVIREQTRIGKVRVLTYPLHDWGWFYGPLGPNPAATLTAGLRYIATTRRDWDLLDLRWVDNDRVDHGRTQRAMESAGFPAVQNVWKESAVIDTSGRFDDYLASMTSKMRNNLKRHERRIGELGKVEFCRYRPRGTAFGEADPQYELYDKCVDLAARSWQGSSTNGTTISSPSVREFFRETHGLAAAAGMLDFVTIQLDGTPVAFGYNYHYQDYICGMRIGYEPSLSKIGIGSLLYLWTLKDSFSRADNMFDMGVGYMEAKEPWLTGKVKCYRYTHYPLGSPRGQLLRMKHWWDRRQSVQATLAKLKATKVDDGAE